jgi:hypothetical protein
VSVTAANDELAYPEKTSVGRPYDRFDEMASRITVMEENLIEMRETLDLVRDTMLKADTTIAAIAAEVKPTLDALTTNPMVKMFLKKGER